MGVRRFGKWLAILAIALQAAWPLLAAAKPRSVALVPLCTVDGVTHYLEVPTGQAPVDHRVHHQHCAFCAMSAAGALLPWCAHPAVSVDRATEVAPPSAVQSYSRSVWLVHSARAPPRLPVRGI